MDQLQNDDMLKDAPAFKQMMEDTLREQQLFKERIEKILPIVKQGKGPADTIVTSDGKEHKVPEGSMPVVFPIPFDDNLSIILGVDEGTHYEWFQKKHMDVIKDQVSIYDLLNKSYENLFKIIHQKLSIHMITDNMGMLTDGNRLESSLIMTGEIWTSIQNVTKTEDLIFAIPTQDVFVFVRADKADDVALMEKKVKEIFADPAYPKKLSSKLYLRKASGEVVVFAV